MLQFHSGCHVRLYGLFGARGPPAKDAEGAGGVGIHLQLLCSTYYQHKTPVSHRITYYEAAPLVGRGWRGAGMAFSNLHKGVITANGCSEVTSPESPAIPVRPSTFKVKIEPTGITDGKRPTMTASGDSLHHEIHCSCWKLAGLTPSVHL